jgi:hypothetical protein
MAAWKGSTVEGRKGLRATRMLTLDDLPPADTCRWVVRRKALVVRGVHAGLISAEDACARYGLSPEELHTWQRQFARHGLPGLRARRPSTAGTASYSGECLERTRGKG